MDGGLGEQFATLVPCCRLDLNTTRKRLVFQVKLLEKVLQVPMALGRDTRCGRGLLTFRRVLIEQFIRLDPCRALREAHIRCGLVPLLTDFGRRRRLANLHFSSW